MGDVVNLNSKALTPRQVLENALKETDLTHAYIVLVHADGTFDLRASGDLSQMPGASLYMQDYAVAFVRGEIEGE